MATTETKEVDNTTTEENKPETQENGQTKEDQTETKDTNSTENDSNESNLKESKESETKTNTETDQVKATDTESNSSDVVIVKEEEGPKRMTRSSVKDASKNSDTKSPSKSGSSPAAKSTASSKSGSSPAAKSSAASKASSGLVEERITELKKINALSKEMLDEANRSIKDYKYEIDKLKRRLRSQEDELKKVKDSEKEAKKLEGEVDNAKKLSSLKAERASEMEKNMKIMRENQEDMMQENIELRDKLEKLKRSNSALENDKVRLRRRINELDDKVESSMKKIKALQESVNEYKSYTEDLKMRNSLQEKKLERLSKQQQQSGEKRSVAELDMKDSTEASTSKRQRTDSGSQSPTAEKLQVVDEWVEPKKSEGSTSGRFSNYSYDRKKSSSERQQSDKPDKPVKIGLIGDTNGKYILPHLSKNSKKVWTAITGMQRVDDLEEAVQTKSLFEKIIDQDQVIIMLGSNNIRRGEDGNEVAKRLHAVGKSICTWTGTHALISEIPPTRIGNSDRVIAEVMKVNEGIRSDAKHALFLKRLEPYTLKEILRADGNGFHLTDQAAMEIAKDLDEQAMSPDMAKQGEKVVIPIDERKVGMVIGRKGATRSMLQDQFQVRVICNDDTIIVRGVGDDIRQCVNEIRKITSKFDSSRVSQHTAANTSTQDYDYRRDGGSHGDTYDSYGDSYGKEYRADSYGSWERPSSSSYRKDESSSRGYDYYNAY